MKFLEEFAPLAGRSHLQVLAQTDSTNNRVKELADAGAPSGAAVIADGRRRAADGWGARSPHPRAWGCIVVFAAPDCAGRPPNDRSGACRRGGGAGSAPCGRARLRHQVAERPRLRGAQGQRHSNRARPDAERPRPSSSASASTSTSRPSPPTRRRSRGISTRGRTAP